MATTDYPYINAHCRLMGSFAYYVEDEKDRARESKAPKDAYASKYPYPTGGWHTYSEAEPSYQERLDATIKQLGLEKP